MSRKWKIVTINAEGSRDNGKTFYVEEMLAVPGERWARRAFMAVMKAGAEVAYVPGAGWEQLAYAGFDKLGTLEMAVVEPLWDELMTCVTVVPDRSRPDVRRPIVESDIEEIQTIVHLKFEAFGIHANFSMPGSSQSSTPGSTTTTSEPSSLTTRTSRPPSGPSFHRARRRTPTLTPS